MKRKIKVITSASKDEVIQGDPIIVKTTKPPHKGKANKAVLKLLSNHFNAHVTLISGATAKIKLVEIEDKTHQKGEKTPKSCNESPLK